MAENSESKNLTKEISRRRIFVFVSLFLVIALAGLITEEADKFSHVVDEYVIVGVSALVLILSWIWRKANSLAKLKNQHNIITALFIIALLVQIWAIPVEINDKMDFGNEIPILILLVLTILNRFF